MNVGPLIHLFGKYFNPFQVTWIRGPCLKRFQGRYDESVSLWEVSVKLAGDPKWTHFDFEEKDDAEALIRLIGEYLESAND